jgi:hypothetical protein
MMPITMGGDLNLPELGRGRAAMRAAEALLRTMGGSTVHLRVPAEVLAADDSSQLGIERSARTLRISAKAT